MIDNDILESNNLLGVVVDNNDPTCSGRCKVKVYGVFENTRTEMIPWASPISSNVFGGGGGGSLSVPKLGAIVRVKFNNGDVYAPEYTSIQNIDSNLSALIKDDYLGTHVIMYDTDADISIIYQNKVGFEIYYKGSFINISPEGMITIQHANGESFIQLEGGTINIGSNDDIRITTSSTVEVTADEVKMNGNQTTKVGPGPYTPAILSDVLWGVLSQMATNLDAKFPSTPGVNSALIQGAKNSGSSTNVLISR